MATSSATLDGGGGASASTSMHHSKRANILNLGSVKWPNGFEVVPATNCTMQSRSWPRACQAMFTSSCVAAALIITSAGLSKGNSAACAPG
jgi:hypothetical protein